MKSYYLYLFSYAMLLMLALNFQVGAESSTSNSDSVRISGHVLSKAVDDAFLIKGLNDTVPVPLTFVLPLRNKDELEELIQRIHNSSDQEYFSKYLTTEEFAERFAPTQEDYNKVIDFAQKLGLNITGIHNNRILLNVTGPAISVEKGFNIRLLEYMTSNGRKFHAPNLDPEVPVSIASIINGIVGLDNYGVWHSYKQKKETENTNAASHIFPSGPYGGFSPSDIAKAYNLVGVPANGSDQIIALFELGGYLASDINKYTNYFGLPPAKLINITVDGGSGGEIDAEVTLDIELALALAPESQIYVYEGPNSNQGVLDTYNRIATDNLAKQVSTSWGLGENMVSSQYLNAENIIFMQMAAQGQTIYAAAGDSGAYDDYPVNYSHALVVDDPASQPYVVGVGGTKLTVNPESCSYVSESVWNDGLQNGAGGGGVSAYWQIPSWQANVPNVNSKIHRNVPDVALNADTNTGYAIYYDGQWAVYGGTSCAAPLWAAFTARVNQERVTNNKPVLGFANPVLYAIGTGSPNSGNFHDITNGNNLYYNAGTGYDNATGLGSFNGANLFASLTNFILPSPPKLSPLLNITMSQSAHFKKGKTGTYLIEVSNQGNGTTSGNVTVSITLPKDLTFHSLSGAGWTFNKNTLTCTQNSPLKAGSSYSSIILKVNVNKNAPNSVTTSATVSGGGSVASSIKVGTIIN